MSPFEPGFAVLGIGVDVTQVDRLRAAYNRQGDALLRRIFTHGELDYCWRFPDPFPHLAGRFAAKEAVIKALGFPCDPAEIEIERKADKPTVTLHGRAKSRAEEAGVRELHISLSHTGEVAIAVCTALSR